MSTKSIWSILHFCRINLYGLECFRCVCHELLIRIYLTLLLSVWTFNLLRIMVHYPYNWYAVNIRRDLVKNPVLCLPLFLKFISYFLSPFNIPCLKLCFVNVEEPKKNGTSMLCLGFKEIILVIIVKHIGGSAILTNRRFTRLFLQLGM